MHTRSGNTQMRHCAAKGGLGEETVLPGNKRPEQTRDPFYIFLRGQNFVEHIQLDFNSKLRLICETFRNFKETDSKRSPSEKTTHKSQRGIQSRVGGGDGWGRGEWWEENGNNCT